MTEKTVPISVTFTYFGTYRQLMPSYIFSWEVVLWKRHEWLGLWNQLLWKYCVGISSFPSSFLHSGTIQWSNKWPPNNSSSEEFETLPSLDDDIYHDVMDDLEAAEILRLFFFPRAPCSLTTRFQLQWCLDVLCVFHCEKCFETRSVPLFSLFLFEKRRRNGQWSQEGASHGCQDRGQRIRLLSTGSHPWD